jgi:hypothetical protein
MKNQKEISLNDDEMDKEFFETISRLNDDLDKIDTMEIYTPDEKWFEQMVLNQQEQKKKKYQKELGWFILSAFAILSGVMFTLLEIPQLFLLLQAAAIAVTVVYSFKGVHKQVDGR